MVIKSSLLPQGIQIAVPRHGKKLLPMARTIATQARAPSRLLGA